MKKIVALLLALAAVLTLCACSKCEHEWNRATCTDPKTCALCGKTTGEALGHDWVDATCAEPKTCLDCGATKGEALGHTWEAATPLRPKTCSTCNSMNSVADPTLTGGGSAAGGAVSLSYSKNVELDLSERTASLNLGNPSGSRNTMGVHVVIQGHIITDFDIVLPGYRMFELALREGMDTKLQAGDYEGKIVIVFYDRTTGEQHEANAEIPVTVAVTE